MKNIKYAIISDNYSASRAKSYYKNINEGSYSHSFRNKCNQSYTESNSLIVIIFFGDIL